MQRNNAVENLKLKNKTPLFGKMGTPGQYSLSLCCGDGCYKCDAAYFCKPIKYCHSSKPCKTADDYAKQWGKIYNENYFVLYYAWHAVVHGDMDRHKQLLHVTAGLNPVYTIQPVVEVCTAGLTTGCTV